MLMKQKQKIRCRAYSLSLHASCRPLAFACLFPTSHTGGSCAAFSMVIYLEG